MNNMTATHHDTTPKNSFKHLSLSERGVIYALLHEKKSVRYIAARLKRSPSTISREIKRGTAVQIRSRDLSAFSAYFPETGQAVYDRRRANNGFHKKLAYAEEFLAYAKEMILLHHWSPDTVVGFCKNSPEWKNKIILCTKTLYNYIDQQLIPIKNIDLALKVRLKKHSKRSRAHKRIFGNSIDERDSSVALRKDFGHWEIDTVIGKRSNDSALMTLTERKTRMELIVPIASKTTEAVNNAIEHLMKLHPHDFKKWFKSITADNGSEFAGLSKLLDNVCPVFFAHPYSAWERGTNERHNGLIRRFIPKSKRMSDISAKTLKRIQNWCNNLPRKILKYKTPYQVFQQEIAAIQ
jgi:IS30 family transposase